MRVDSGKFTSVGVLSRIWTWAVKGAASKDSFFVKAFSFKRNGESLEVKPTATDETKYTHFVLDIPRGLVVDFHGIQNTISFKEKKIDAAGVQRVRTSFFSDESHKATRIVFDLAANADYRFVNDGGGNLRILFGQDAHAPLNQVAGPPVAPPLETAVVTETVESPAIVQNPASAITVAGTPARPAEPAVEAAAAVARVSGSSPVIAAAENAAARSESQITVVPQTPPQLPSTTPTPTPQYSGEIISLDLRDYYVKADTVSAILKGLLSFRGNIITDERRNALIVTDISSQFTNIESMVKFLDTPAQQFEIEARLLQANKSFSRDIGNQIGLLFGNRTGNVLTGLPNTSSGFARTPPPRVATGSGVPLISDFAAAGKAGLSFLIQPGGDVLLDEIISVFEARGTARLISRPRVTTQNNVPATIQQGTQIPVQTNVNNTITVQFTSFTLNLTVTPQITEAGTILLRAAITNSQPDFAKAVGGIPSVSTQSATTQVLIPDGGTAVIGGILVDTDSVNVKQVPGLGNLPLIGTLFKDTATVKTTSELLFFITPRIKPLEAISVLTPGEEQSPAQPQQR